MKTQMGQLAAPCGIYCGMCAIHIAPRDDNQKSKERLTSLFRGAKRCRICGEAAERD